MGMFSPNIIDLKSIFEYFIQSSIFIYMKMDNNKPFPVRLGELKPMLQQAAAANDRSLHYWILKMIRKGMGVEKPKPAS
jgi:hypothetical protein